MTDESSRPQAGRRQFLGGAAAAAIGGALATTAGGVVLDSASAETTTASGLLLAHSYVRADSIPNHPYVKAWPDLGPRAYIKGYGFAELPFPTEPGALLSTALKAVYGVFQRCLCITPQAVLNFVGLGGGKMDVRMEGGVGVGIGGGQDDLIKQICNVVLHPGEHISRGINDLLGTIFVNHDGNRPSPPSFILPIDVEHIMHQVIRLINPINWPEIIGNFIKNPLSIFNEVLGFFFPVRQEMNFQVEVTCEKFPGLTLVNKDTIKVKSDSLTSFPPKNAAYATPGPVEFVDKNDPNGRPLLVMERWENTVDHRKALPPQVHDGTAVLYPETVDADLACAVD